MISSALLSIQVTGKVLAIPFIVICIISFSPKSKGTDNSYAECIQEYRAAVIEHEQLMEHLHAIDIDIYGGLRSPFDMNYKPLDLQYCREKVNEVKQHIVRMREEERVFMERRNTKK